MLHELADYAVRYGVSVDPGFKAKESVWTIVLSEEGRYIDVVRDERLFPKCPHLEQNELIAGGITRSHFLLDSLAVVVGYGRRAGEAGKADDDKHRYFVWLLEQAGTCEALLAKCSVALNDEDTLKRMAEKLQASKARGTDKCTLRIGGQYVLDLDTWHRWWRQHRASIRDTGTSRSMRCLLSGELTTPVTNHPKVAGLTSIGGSSMGAVLSGFDKEAFSSYGLQQALNSACSEQSVTAYRDALQDLVRKAPKPFANTLFLHWYKEPIGSDDDLLDFGEFERAESSESSARLRAERLFRSLQDGRRPELTHNRYYILQMSANAGRIMLRDWLCGDFSDLVYQVRSWFDDLTIVSPHGLGEGRDFKLAAALIRLVAYRPKEALDATFKRVNDEVSWVMPRIWRSILTGGALPDFVAERSMRYIRSRLLAAREGDREGETDRNLDWIACALLKAWVVRRERQDGGEGSVKACLHTEHPSPAYHAGRMMAVLAEIQRAALGEVGAGVVQRYYSAASTTPSLVLGRLVRLSQYHLDRLDKRSAAWYEEKLTSIAVRLGDGVPATLSLEEQALFALGYYQQKAVLLAARADSRTRSSDEANEASEPSLQEGA